jgi:uncharacterized protein YgbK (DUF1537 family)
MIGVVADDITGANDIGIMFSKSNYAADVFSLTEAGSVQPEQTDVMIIDTDSRLDSEHEAYRKVFQATKELQKLGVQQFFNKTCSVFRGNIGAEFDAMLEALDENFAVIVLGFPKNGRKTIDGIHYVHGQLLEESEFRNDPVHPMKDSNLVRILQSQTKRKVANINQSIVKKGAEVLREEIFSLKQDNQYVIVDVTEQADLKVIARAVYDFKVLAGSSALAEELPQFIGKKEIKAKPAGFPPYYSEKGLFCTAGSLMPQTAAQINYMRGKETVLELNTLNVIEEEKRNETIAQLTKQIISQLNKGKNVVLHTSNDKEIVRLTKEEALKNGINNRDISRLVSFTIAEITYAVIHITGQRRFVVAGGDTSAAVCRRLGIKGMRVWEEIQPGLPSCISLSNEPMLFVLKSGSFGQENFIEQAFQHLREQCLFEEETLYDGS